MGEIMDIKPVAFNYNAEKNLEMLSKASFLTTMDTGAVNTMIIAWGAVGSFWRLPVFVAAVRKNRYSCKTIEKTGEFSITIPDTEPSTAVQDVCGFPYNAKSNKLTAAGLKVLEPIRITVPVLALPAMHYECKVLFKAETFPEAVTPALAELWYKKEPENGHILFFGEIVASYISK